MDPWNPIKSDGRITRADILKNALTLTMDDRNKTYGDPSVQVALGARWFREFMEHAGKKYSDYHNGSIEDVFQKLSRIACGAYKADNYDDGTAYFAMAGEAAAMAELKAQKPKPDLLKCPACGKTSCAACRASLRVLFDPLV